MEDVLSVSTRPYSADYPVLGMDEISKQLVKETRKPLPMKPGEAECYDFEYEREGVRNMFLACEPLRGTRSVRRHRAPHKTRLGPIYPRTGRCVLSTRQKSGSGHGQPQYACPLRAL